MCSRRILYCVSLYIDDGSVRDSERKAALLHFNTDQVGQSTSYFCKGGLIHNTSYMYMYE